MHAVSPKATATTMLLPMCAVLSLAVRVGAVRVGAVRAPSFVDIDTAGASARATPVAPAECPRSTGTYTKSCSSCNLVSAYPDCLLRCACDNDAGTGKQVVCYRLQPKFQCEDSKDFGSCFCFGLLSTVH